MNKRLTNYINLILLIFAVSFTSCDKTEEELALFEVHFDANEGTPVGSQLVLQGDTVLKPADPTLEGSEFIAWTKDDVVYDFNQTVSEGFTLTATYKRVYEVGKTEVVYQMISHEDFIAMESNKHMVVKAQINYLMFGWAWGTEAFITDPEGNSSKDFYDHSNFGMFSFPLKFTKDDAHIEGQTFVFDVVKDVYMSSPQLGFGYGRNEEFDETGTGAYNGAKWLAPMRYGIEYFNKVVRGNVREVTFTAEEGLTVTVGETVIAIKTLGTEEGTYDDVTEDYVAKVEAMLGQNKYVRTIEVDGKVISVLRDENLQFSDSI
ncbi:InlB B-repeat-containing protein [Flammeovirga aprica]|uniref:InlB B-repeat-containing protein n=1 Tax=Flammeovirga aprica JL-4 TaxID=694437 RepID=A0A7X9RTK6_9BACT|nr:InlB B-repeat-containing protein [Flammeovirga aprica]NME67444.1 InlB B-repeat-containing protein [Flammeovirga aprica JL-4]